MSYEEAVSTIRQFVETQPACRQALAHLKTGTEIRLIVDQRHEGALFYKDGQAHFEPRAARKPDVEFGMSLEAIRRLSKAPGDDMAKLGIEVVRLIVAGEISVRVCGSVFGVLSNGYLSIIKEAGPDFTRFLASHGLKGVSRITSVIRSLKKG